MQLLSKATLIPPALTGEGERPGEYEDSIRNLVEQDW
jgi:hypothetical protein